MAKQYGAPDEPNGRGNGYDQKYGRRDAEPQPKDEDPSPPQEVVIRFHKNAPVDTRREDIHHTIGYAPGQAAPGEHNHRTEGVPLFDGLTITGSRGNNVALTNLIALLTQFGLKDSTTT